MGECCYLGTTKDCEEIEINPLLLKIKFEIKVPKSIIIQEEDWQKFTLIGQFVGIRPHLDVIRR